MNKQDYDFDTVPYDEPCAQVGEENYHKDSRTESRAMMNQLIRMFGMPPDGSYLTLKSNPHDFGDYLSIRYVWDDDRREHVAYFNKLEAGWPDVWDREAKEELKKAGYTL